MKLPDMINITNLNIHRMSSFRICIIPSCDTDWFRQTAQDGWPKYFLLTSLDTNKALLEYWLPSSTDFIGYKQSSPGVMTVPRIFLSTGCFLINPLAWYAPQVSGGLWETTQTPPTAIHPAIPASLAYSISCVILCKHTSDREFYV